jgi:hypothetical protein
MSGDHDKTSPVFRIGASVPVLKNVTCDGVRTSR